MMAINADNDQDLSAHMVTKHSWKGKYRRIFIINQTHIRTLNWSTLQETNRWPLSDVADIAPNQQTTSLEGEFSLVFRRRAVGRSESTLRFSCDHRAALLQSAKSILNNVVDPILLHADRFTWAAKWVPVRFQISPCGIIVDGQHRSEYDFSKISSLVVYSSDSHISICMCFGSMKRLHHFRFSELADRDRAKAVIVSHAHEFVGTSIPTDIVSHTDPVSHYTEHRFSETYRTDWALIAMLEFNVSKHPRKDRLLCLTAECVIERDPLTYRICSLLPYNYIFSIVRPNEDDRLVNLMTKDGKVHKYLCSQRDDLLVALLDQGKSNGCLNLFVQSTLPQRGHRFVSFEHDIDQELHLALLKLLDKADPNSGNEINRLVRILNANTNNTSAAVADVRLMNGTIANVLQSALKMMNGSILSPVEQYLISLRRLLASPSGCECFSRSSQIREMLGVLSTGALSDISIAGISTAYGMMDALSMLLQPSAQQSECTSSDLLREQRNKRHLLQSTRFLNLLLDHLTHHAKARTGALLILTLLDYFTLIVCAPFSETTDGSQFDMVLTVLTEKAGSMLYDLVQNQNSPAIRRSASMIIRTLIEESNASISRQMIHLSLTSASFISHLSISLFGASKGTPMAGQAFIRKLSRNLISLWTSDGQSGKSFELLQRCFPAGMIQYLLSQEQPPEGARDFVVSEEGKQTPDPAERDNLNLVNHEVPFTTFDRYTMKVEDQISKLLSHWRTKFNTKFSPDQQRSTEDDDGGVIVLRRRRTRVRANVLNWPLFFYQFYRDHNQPDLIWDFRTRRELRESLSGEYARYQEDMRRYPSKVHIAWNHAEFSINYRCLSHELKVGNYYLRLLTSNTNQLSGEREFGNGDSSLPIENMSKQSTSFIEPADFFAQLYHRFLLTPHASTMKYSCLRALSLVYSRCHSVIGKFTDMDFVVDRVKRANTSMERNLLIEFINSLSLNRANAISFVQTGGIAALMELLPLGHLHTDRPRLVGVAISTDMIQASVDAEEDETAAQWFYLEGEGHKRGPLKRTDIVNLYETGKISRKTNIWAPGMMLWRPMEKVGQFFWTILVSDDIDDEEDQSAGKLSDLPMFIKNETDMAVTILKVLHRLCNYFPGRDADDAVLKPAPKIITALSHPQSLATLVQLLLTFDPVLTESIASLLCAVMTDNPCVSSLYETGLFFFLLMYQGSNLLPIARLLHKTHLQQATRVNLLRSEGPETDAQKSILASMLPGALIFFLQNHGPEELAKAFVSECRTPEIIWNTSLRRHLVQQIAVHVADYSSRLRSNIFAPFRYCPIAFVNYPDPLRNQLFCNQFYLKELCEHPAWPVANPVQLLKDCLKRWRDEMVVTSPDINMTNACATLDIELDNKTEASQQMRQVRQAYFRLAQQHHPDKNPNADPLNFDRICKSYEFLINNLSNTSQADGQDVLKQNNISILIKVQIYLYKRFYSTFVDYKYAGFIMLIDVLKSYDVDADDMFNLGKDNSMLPMAIELCVETVRSSALNAEAIRAYPDALTLLCRFFTRCSAILTASSRYEDLPTQICLNIAKFWTVAATFDSCRAEISESLASELCHVVRVSIQSELPKLTLAALRACQSLCADRSEVIDKFTDCQLWVQLIKSLFTFDVTFKPLVAESDQEEDQLMIFDDDRINSNQNTINEYVKVSMMILLEPSHSFKRVVGPLLPEWFFEHSDRMIEDLLGEFHKNVRHPLLVWNETCRKELLAFLNQPDPNSGDFAGYSALANEPNVNGCYLRPYQEQPDATEDIERYLYPGLLVWVAERMNENENDQSVQLGISCMQLLSDRVELNVTDAEMHLIYNLIEPKWILQVSKMLASMCHHENTMQRFGSDPVLAEMLLDCLRHTSTSDAQIAILKILNAIVNMEPRCGDVMSLMHVQRSHFHFARLLCTQSLSHAVRVEAASLLLRFMTDPLTGPIVKLDLHRVVPNVLLENLGDSSLVVRLHDEDHDNPEFSWTNAHRDRVLRCLISFDENTAEDGALANLEDIDLSNDMCIAGVKIKSYLATPGWQVRDPFRLGVGLLEELAKLMDDDEIDHSKCGLLRDALLRTWYENPQVLNAVPASGFVLVICQYLDHSNETVAATCFRLLGALASNTHCQDCLASLGDQLFERMRRLLGTRRSDLIISEGGTGSIKGCAGDVLMELIGSEKHGGTYTGQALNSGLVELLISKICDDDVMAGHYQDRSRAQIVSLVKKMMKLRPEPMQAVCDKYPKWAREFQQQSHELFIDHDRSVLFLDENSTGSMRMIGAGGGNRNIAGYLTSGSAINSGDLPPPVDQVDTT